MWRWTGPLSSQFPVSIAPGYFATGVGFLGTVYNNTVKDKELVTGLRIQKTDNYPVSQDLKQWLLFCDVGATLYIRGASVIGSDKVDEVAYYEVIYAPFEYNGGNEVYFIVNHIDSNYDATQGTGNDYIPAQNYHIGYINNNSSSVSANAVRFNTAGINTPDSGQFALKEEDGSVNPGWQGATQLHFDEPVSDALGNTQTNWFNQIREGDIVTIRQRGNEKNYGMYEVISANQSSAATNYLEIQHITSQNTNAPQAVSGAIAATDGFVVAPIPQITYYDPVTNAPTTVGQTSFKVEYEITITPSGQDGNDGQDGQDGAGLNGAVGVSFCMSLTGQPSSWNTASGNAPPSSSEIGINNGATICTVLDNAPYITYTGQTSAFPDDGTSQGFVVPNLAKHFEFIKLEGNTLFTFPSTSGNFPRELHHQESTFHNPFGGPYNIPELGPQTGEFKNHNNFYGFRIPRDGKLLGFQINHIASPNYGQFYAFVFNKTGGGAEELRFTYPIVSSIGMNQESQPYIMSNSYAAGNTQFNPDRYIDVKKDGYLFIAQDLSYRPVDGPNSTNWNTYWRNVIGGNDTGLEEKVDDIPVFTPARGQFHATAYLRYD